MAGNLDGGHSSPWTSSGDWIRTVEEKNSVCVKRLDARRRRTLELGKVSKCMCLMKIIPDMGVLFSSWLMERKYGGLAAKNGWSCFASISDHLFFFTEALQ